MDETKTQPQEPWWKRKTASVDGAVCAVDLRPGSRCPACGKAALAYDGLFLLTCPRCGYVAESGGFT